MGQKSYTLDELKAMPKDKAKEILATPGSAMQGTGVVRSADGKVRYDNDGELAGQYNEHMLKDMKTTKSNKGA